MHDYKPIIKPTPLPKITVDRNKVIPASGSSPDPTLSNSAPMTDNANATPSRGGLLDNINKFMGDQAKAEQPRSKGYNEARTPGDLGIKLPGRAIGWLIAIFFVFPFGGIIGAFVDEVTDKTSTNESSISQPAELDSNYETVDNSCFKATIPASDGFGTYTSEFLSCHIGFDTGYISAIESYASSASGEVPPYTSIEEYADYLDYQITSSEVHGDNTFYILDKGRGVDDRTEYLLWLADQEVFDQNGARMEQLSVILETNTPSLEQIKDNILASIVIK